MMRTVQLFQLLVIKFWFLMILFSLIFHYIILFWLISNFVLNFDVPLKFFLEEFLTAKKNSGPKNSGLRFSTCSGESLLFLFFNYN
uniref:Uncharacterized protein n=1 Tax=Cannabis sativa TaxID=3483 RepID=A0A803QTE1_CANSA